MDSVKDILKNLKGERESTDKKDQEELFDTSSLSKKDVVLNDSHKYISKEYQYYGLRLAGKLEDPKRVTMYIKWAKEKPRAILEQAFSFAIDYPSAKNKSRLFMWKVKELEKEYKAKKEKENS